MYIRDDLVCLLLKNSQAQYFIRIGNIDQMMRYPRLLFARGFGSANIHAAIKETRIGRDDLAMEPLCELNRDLRLADGSGTNN